MNRPLRFEAGEIVPKRIKSFLRIKKKIIEEKKIKKEGWGTQICRFSNCKLAVQYKVGLQRLAQLGYSNVHR